MVKFANRAAYDEVALKKKSIHKFGAKWTSDEIRKLSDIIFGPGEYLYETPDNVVDGQFTINATTKMNVYCKMCNQTFLKNTNQHFCGYPDRLKWGSGCGECQHRRREKYTPSIIHDILMRNYGDRFSGENLLATKEKTIKAKDYVDIMCRKCLKVKTVQAMIIIYGGSNHMGCEDCGSRAVWSKERFNIVAKEVHGDEYEYPNIDNFKWNGIDTELEVLHKLPGCGQTFTLKLYSHFTRKKGCSICYGHKSMPEAACEDILTKLGYKFQTQVSFTGYPYKFDIFIESSSTIIEIDGRQHFIRSNFWHPGDKFEQNRRNDCIKTRLAIDKGCNIIRIRAYEKLGYNRVYDRMEFYLADAFNKLRDITSSVYYSDDESYDWIINSEQMVGVDCRLTIDQ